MGGAPSIAPAMRNPVAPEHACPTACSEETMTGIEGAPGAEALESAMRAAIDAAASPSRTLPNPRVGCVLLAPDGSTLATGAHHGAGLPHAEIEALAHAG